MSATDFWSRRKAAVAAEVEAEQAELQAERSAQEQAALAERTDEEILEELGLKDPDTMEPGDDFSAFMKAKVPDRLRRRALRRLWLSNPVLANLDGLVDYDEDFTDAATVVENLKTAYRVGQGMLKHVEALAVEGADPEGRETSPPAQIVALEDVPVMETSPTETATAEVEPENSETASAERGQHPRRRMRFEFT